jgi:hypothetical protein
VRINLNKKMGLEMGHDTLTVVAVNEGGQADAKKVRPGWVCKKVGKSPVVNHI